MSEGKAKRISQLRLVVSDYLSRRLYSSAIYYSDILVSISNDPQDIYQLADCYFFNKQFRRAVQIMKHHQILPNHHQALYLAACCLYELSEWEECVELIEQTQIQDQNLRANFCVVRGKAYFELEQRNQARSQWIEALSCDPKCYDAFELLEKHHMLSVEETNSLLVSLKFAPEDQMLKSLLLSHAAKFDSNPQESLEKIQSQFEIQNNRGFNLLQAELLFNRQDFQNCHQITSQLLRNDPYDYGKAMLIHLSAMVELRLKNELFHQAHKLVESTPNTALSWYAVGAYYYCIGDFEKSRSFFSKATGIDPNFGAGWLGYGHAFAGQGEYDQAVAAYRTAFRMISGNHIPPLCIGMELIRVRNFSQAEQFLNQALKICPTDPLVWNELGVVALNNRDYEEACSNFTNAIKLCGNRVPDVWEATYCNLGHSLRKLQKYEEAMDAYQRALSLCPNDNQVKASILSAIGFTHQISGDADEAINYYHKALGLNPEDRFTLDMLWVAIGSVSLII